MVIWFVFWFVLCCVVCWFDCNFVGDWCYGFVCNGGCVSGDYV